MFGSSLPIADFISSVVLTIVAFSIALKGKKSPFIHLNDTPALFCYALLSALALSKFSSFTYFHSVLSIAALPVLSQYAAGYYPFQLANVYSIYSAISKSDLNLGHIVLSAALHGYLLLASLDINEFMPLADIKDIILCTEGRRLAKIQKIRDIVFDDIKKLPERLCLKNADAEFKYDVNESFFLLRAMVRVMWRPMLPLCIISTIIGTLTLVRYVTRNCILHFVDYPSEHSWFSGYIYVIIEACLCICCRQLSTVEALMNEEIKQISSPLKLNLFRLPLSHKGLHNSKMVSRAMRGVDNVVTHMENMQYIISIFPSAIAAFIPLYSYFGWLSLIPFGVAVANELLKSGLKMLFGDQYKWYSQYQHGADNKINDIYHNIKSIKMFGWEKMYVDPKLKEYWKMFDSKEIDLWYAPIARCLWMCFYIIYGISEKLSTFLMLYFHFQRTSESSQPLTAIDMFWLDDLISQTQINAQWYVEGKNALSSIIGINNHAEKVLKGSYINTLPHYPIAETEKHIAAPEHPIDCSKPLVHINSGEFYWNKDILVLKDVSLSVDRGELVAVIGATGSGKSSLLLSICGELEMKGGNGAVVGSMALVEQTPWIMNGTLRENILFGHDYDEEYYNKVVYACALVDDINNWIGGDLTVIGERGINISGGQKARLALARAVYSRADIFVMDDPLSAVDAHVKRHILDHVIMDSGLLAGKIRIMSLNSQSLLPYFDKVLTLDDSKCANVSQNTRQDYQPLTDKADAIITGDEAYVKEPNIDSDTDPKLDSLNDNSETAKKKWSNWDHAKFVLKMCGAPTLAIIFLTALLKPVSRYMFDSYKMDTFKNLHGTSNLTNADIQKYLFIAMFKKCCLYLIGDASDYMYSLLSELHLKPRIKGMFIGQLTHAPLSFFDSTNRQEISSAYNNGTETMSSDIPKFLRTKISDIADAILMIYRIGTNAPQLLVFVPMFVWALVNRELTRGSVSLSLDRIETQMIINQDKVDAIIADGKRLIRIFDVGNYFTEAYIDEEDKNLRVHLPQHLFNNYVKVVYRLWYRIIFALCKSTVLIINQIFRYKISSAELVVYTSMTDLLADSISDIISFKSDALSFRNNIETFRQYMDIDGEKMFVENATVPEEQWPAAGKIELQDFSMKYHEDLEYVLKDINLTINPGEKIGIVGRTGAGKTSLTRALFCLIDSKTCNGSIVIDGHDIFSLNIGDLRPKLGIIPQEPTMFGGSFRQNLDPLVKYSIADMWAAIIKCGIVENIQPKDAHNSKNIHENIDKDKLEEIEDWNKDWEKASWNMRLFLYLFIAKPRLDKADMRKVRPFGLSRHAGNSFSDGQKQIFGLCRLLMRNRKIIVLDEATANVDMETDQQMQKLIRSEFKDCTVLTIAHRLETIMNSDRIIVMDNGRIAEIGSPAELLEKKGHFAELVEANDFGQ